MPQLLISRTWLIACCVASLLALDCRRTATPSSCSDSTKNGQETDVDCGGSACAPCELTHACRVANDCASGVCVGRVCATSSCQDKVKSGDEADVDCGGSCPACDVGATCTSPNDCQSAACTAGACSAPSCTDTVRNGTETDVDCGGSCASCQLNAACRRNSDCALNSCVDGRCQRFDAGTGSAIDAGIGPTGCRAPSTSCDGGCLDLRFDRANCGGCGVRCAATEVCLEGACLPGCGPGLSSCGGNRCVDFGADVAHCGGCSTACDAGAVCQSGQCTSVCPAGTVRCDGACVRLDSDNAHCGGCGQPCTGGLVCNAGMCGAQCNPPLQRCSGACIDPMSDPDHCGGCDLPCPALPNAGRLCLYGSCGRTACTPGFADCNVQMIDGCEISLTADDNNCGHCATVCTGGQHCDAGACE